MDTLSNVMSRHLRQSEIEKFLSPIFADPWSKKLRSPHSSVLNPLTRDLSGLAFVELQNGHVFTTCW